MIEQPDNGGCVDYLIPLNGQASVLLRLATANISPSPAATTLAACCTVLRPRGSGTRAARATAAPGITPIAAARRVCVSSERVASLVGGEPVRPEESLVVQ